MCIRDRSVSGIKIQGISFLSRNLVSTNAITMDGIGYRYSAPTQTSRKSFNTFAIDNYTSRTHTIRAYSPDLETNFNMVMLGTSLAMSFTFSAGTAQPYGLIRAANSYWGSSYYNAWAQIPLWHPMRRNIILDNILVNPRYPNGSSSTPSNQFQTMNPIMNFRPWQLSSNISLDGRAANHLYPTWPSSVFSVVDGDSLNEETYVKSYHGIEKPSVITGTAYGGSGFQTQKNPRTREYTIYKIQELSLIHI